MYLDEDRRGLGFSTTVSGALEDYYRASGVHRIELIAAKEDGGYTWAATGYDWDPRDIETSVRSIRRKLAGHAREARDRGDEAAAAAFEGLDEQLRTAGPDELPSPRSIARMTNPAVEDFGRTVLRGTTWHAVRWL